MIPEPNSAAAAFSRAAISSSASSHEMRSKASGPALPLAAILFIGYSRRSGEYTRSRVLGNLAAEKSAGHGMIRIAFNSSGAPIFDGDQDGTGIGTVVRAGGVNNAGHAGL